MKRKLQTASIVMQDPSHVKRDWGTTKMRIRGERIRGKEICGEGIRKGCPYGHTSADTNDCRMSRRSDSWLFYPTTNLPALPLPEWEDFSDRVEQGFLTDEKKIPQLITHWHGIFPECTYAYSKANLIQAVAGVRMDDREMRTVREALDALGLENSRRDVNAVFVRMSDDFYHYNIIADDIRQFVNGQRVIDEEWAHLVRRMADINSNNVNN